jgi:hypothetical protein
MQLQSCNGGASATLAAILRRFDGMHPTHHLADGRVGKPKG